MWRDTDRIAMRAGSLVAAISGGMGQFAVLFRSGLDPRIASIEQPVGQHRGVHADLSATNREDDGRRAENVAREPFDAVQIPASHEAFRGRVAGQVPARRAPRLTVSEMSSSTSASP